jgi:hypothetical protein
VKKLLLALVLCFGSMQAITLEQTLDLAGVTNPQRRVWLSYVCNLLEKMSIDDRTIVYMYLEDLNDEDESKD